MCEGEEDEMVGVSAPPLGLQQMKRHSTPATLMWMDQHYHLAEVTHTTVHTYHSPPAHRKLVPVSQLYF